MPPPPDTRDPLISGPPKFRWPWEADKEVQVTTPARSAAKPLETAGPVVQAPPFGMPGVKAPTLPPFRRPYEDSAAPAAWKTIVVRLAIITAIAYHAAAALAWITGPDDGRAILSTLGGMIPKVAGVDVGHWFATGGVAWYWQPRVAIVGAFLLRLAGFNGAARDPVSAIWLAATALAVDAATWVFIGLKLATPAYSPAEAAALITLLKIECAVLLGLFFVLAPTGRRKPGETDAHWNRG